MSPDPSGRGPRLAARVWLRGVLVSTSLLCSCSAHQAARFAIKSIPTTLVHDTLLSFPEELMRANFDLAAATSTLIAKATELPPKAVITLSDLAPELREFQGQEGYDFLRGAKESDGRPVTFEYARFNSPVYDAFLRDAALAKAMAYQALGTIKALSELSSSVLHEQVAPGAALHHTVTRALASEKIDLELKGRLERMVRLGRSLGVMLPRFVRRVHALVEEGQQLVTSADQALASVVLLTHLPDAVKSLSTSVGALAATGRWALEIAPSLRGFGKDHGKRHPVDVSEGRLTRAELQELLFEP